MLPALRPLVTRHSRWLILSLLLVLNVPSPAWAQGDAPRAGSLDPGFDPGRALAALPGVTGPLGLVGVQPGGTVVVSYTTNQSDGKHSHLARLNPDGSLAAGGPYDAGVGTSPSGAIVQPDGRVLAGFTFLRREDSAFEHETLLRLGPDLLPDPGFVPSDNLGRPAALQADGAVLVRGGSMGLLRLRPDGHPDPGFRAAPELGNRTLGSVSVQADGKLLISAFFAGGGPTFTAGLRLNADGSLDAGFRPVEIGTVSRGFTPSLSFFEALPDGRALLGGSFSTINGVPRSGVTRLNTDGSVDAGYDFANGIRAINAFVPPDGRVLLHGSDAVTRLNADGTPDAGFFTGRRFGTRAAAVQPDGKVLVGGGFSAFFNGVARPGVARFNADGSLDESFFVDVTGSPSTSLGVETIARQADGSILLGGDFRRVNGEVRVGVARLRADGSLDGGFRADVGGSDFAAVSQVLPLPDGSILLVGNFLSVNGVPRARLARLSADGRVDPGFDAESVQLSIFGRLATFVQPDGRLLVSGNFPEADGAITPSVVRLNADGSRDASYDARADGAPSFLARLAAVQPDGKAIVNATDRRVFNGVHLSLVRLDANGRVDPSFVLRPEQFGYRPGGAIPDFGRVTPLPDGRLLVSVALAANGFNGSQRSRLRRFNADGSLDPTFAAEEVAGFDDLHATAQADGRLVVSGTFGLARYGADGQPDPGFVFRQGIEGSVARTAVQADGGVLISGNFPRVQGVARPGLARLRGAAPAGSPARPTVGVAVDRPTVSRGAGETATVSFTRTGDDLSRTVRVVYRLAGLVNGTDYAGLPVVKKLKAGRASASVTVRALPGGGNGKVKLTLLPGVGYDVSAAAGRVKVKVTD